MDGQPEILSAGPPEREQRPVWPRLPGGRGPVVAAAVLLACAAVALAGMAMAVAHRDKMIDGLRAALATVRHRAPYAAPDSALPVESGTAVLAFPDKSGGSFSMFATAIRPGPHSGPLLWLYVHGQHETPGARYGLLGGTCGGQFVTSADLADGTADRSGDLAMVAPNLSVSPRDPRAWVLLYRMADGVTLGGVRGPFIGGGARAFRSVPPC
jgi:hypothetical protein